MASEIFYPPIWDMTRSSGIKPSGRLCPHGLRQIKLRINSSSSSSVAPRRSGVNTSPSSSRSRHSRKCPSAVRRTLEQEAQKGLVSVLMKPMAACAPSSSIQPRFAVEPSLGDRVERADSLLDPPHNLGL